jgi:hypothetical protein
MASFLPKLEVNLKKLKINMKTTKKKESKIEHKPEVKKVDLESEVLETKFSKAKAGLKLSKGEQISLIISLILLFVLLSVAAVVYSKDKDRINSIFGTKLSSSSNLARVEPFTKDDNHLLLSVPDCDLQFKFDKNYTYSTSADKTDKGLGFAKVDFKTQAGDFAEVTCVKTGNETYPDEIKSEEASFDKTVDLNKNDVSFFDKQTKQNILTSPSPRIFSGLKGAQGTANADLNVELFVVNKNTLLISYNKKGLDISAKSLAN